MTSPISKKFVHVGWALAVSFTAGTGDGRLRALLGLAASVGASAVRWALPRRWAQGGSERSDLRGDGGGEDAAAEARRAQMNAEVKRTLTSLLLEVTDAMFGALLPAVAAARLLVADLVYRISGMSACTGR